MGEAPCERCGASDWGTRNRCNNCNRMAARRARATADAATREKERARLQAWRKANPEKSKAQKLRELYRITPAEFNLLVVQQDGCCAICKSPSLDCVDHSHATGRVRGILCRPCNIGLGQFRDAADLLLAAADYVERGPAK